MKKNKKDLVKKSKEEWKQEYYNEVKDLIEHPIVLEMKKYPHHCNTSCYQHCINVSYYNYRICKSLGLDARSAARAGLLHDLFLYDWRYHTETTGDHFHAMTHPKKALKKALEYFELNTLEKEIILKHMWPLTIVPPTTWEAFIITVVDKHCGFCEIADYYSGKLIPAIAGFSSAKTHEK